MRGLLLTLMGDRIAGENSLREAISVAQQQGARFFELRAVMDLARHWIDHGKEGDVRDLLAPVYGCFTEGFDSRDLKEAESLLDTLGMSVK
jgi:predicted ATPase